jgi:hypothetical protein
MLYSAPRTKHVCEPLALMNTTINTLAVIIESLRTTKGENTSVIKLKESFCKNVGLCCECGQLHSFPVLPSILSIHFIVSACLKTCLKLRVLSSVCDAM